MRLISASNHRLWNTRDQYWQGSVYKPEDQLFVSRIHKERNIQVCAAFNGIVKTIKAQNFCVFFVKEVIVVKLHDIAGLL